MSNENPESKRDRLWRIIFLSDTRRGKAFDVVLLWLIVLSVIVVMLESVESIRESHFMTLRILEWIFTVLFTIEYITRIAVSPHPGRYVTSFFGIVDLLSILPAFILLALPQDALEQGMQLSIIRVLRLLRMFRVLKMVRYVGEGRLLMIAMRSSLPKISVFMFCVLTLVMIMGTMLYIVENTTDPPNEGFQNIPQSIYWAIVTITTVGYGDATPMTITGKILASIMMLTGYAIIAVPTGIVGSAVFHATQVDARECQSCGTSGHVSSATFCRDCGAELTNRADERVSSFLEGRDQR